MKISNVIRTIQTYSNPLWFYVVCYKLAPMRITTMSLTNALKFYIRPHKSDLVVLNEVFATKDYDIAIKRLQPRTSVVVDIGGHIGTFTIKASLHAKKVIVYEPEKENAFLLKKNVELNKRGNIKVMPFGIARKQGKYPMYISKKNANCNSMYSTLTRNASHTQMIECKNFEDEMRRLKLKRINLLKVDCEGAEFEILMSLKRETFDVIDSIIAEYHDGAGIGYDHSDLIALLGKRGFQVKTVNKIDDKTGLLYATKTEAIH